ncbi:putative pterin-4-alpha-carbinolamine dehydratase [Apostichopus japonicus]
MYFTPKSVVFILLVATFWTTARALSLLTDDERNEFLPKLLDNGWNVMDNRDAIRKSFAFSDFNEAFGFMTRCAMKIEREQHHPEWFNVYNRLEVVLTTHDVGGLSSKDITIATFMDEMHLWTNAST